MAPKVRPFEATVKPPVDFAGSIIISDSASLAGTHIIKIGAFSVIHPRAKLVTTLGPITIGSECIINERATIAAPDAVGLTIHDGVVVETNAVIEARLLGEDSTIEVGAKVGKRAIIGKVRSLICCCQLLLVTVQIRRDANYAHSQVWQRTAFCLTAR